jgi:hypothetical protein
MSKTIKDNGRTLVRKEMKTYVYNACPVCERSSTFEESKNRDCGKDAYWRETLLSRLSRFIKRIGRK